ncbi:MAG: class I SAM-dependent methyltransferase [Microgenomates group bacterium]
MQKSTIIRLNQLNHDFYSKTAPYFARSREFYWQGWLRLEPYFRRHTKLSVLDIGCGSARFAEFLYDAFPKTQIGYQGVDANSDLLKIASDKLRPLQGLHGSVSQVDIISQLESGFDPLPNDHFDVIALMGILHHVPSLELRRKLIETATQKLAPQGFLFMSFWQPHRFSRYTAKLISPESVEIDPQELEPGDCFLPWDRGEHAVRYVHSSSDLEISSLTKDLKLKLMAEFRADGRSQRENQYILLQNSV